jgi:hypothetical protein
MFCLDCSYFFVFIDNSYLWCNVKPAAWLYVSFHIIVMTHHSMTNAICFSQFNVNETSIFDNDTPLIYDWPFTAQLTIGKFSFILHLTY